MEYIFEISKSYHSDDYESVDEAEQAFVNDIANSNFKYTHIEWE